MITQAANSAPDDLAALLALNNADAERMSRLDAASLARLLSSASHARKIGTADALLIAFDDAAEYDNVNFAWFAARHPRFVYIDRIVVADHARGRGLARRLYEDLFTASHAAGCPLVGCEIYLDPPNPESDAFHTRLGFAPVGQAALANGRTVRYWARSTAP